MSTAGRDRRLPPSGSERHLLGRFYAADFVGYALDLALPFQFVYLYLVLDWSEWAPLPFVLQTASFLILELATGVWADRYGRKPITLTGDALTAGAYVTVPLAAAFAGGAQLIAVCAAFSLLGAGESLRSGAAEAWVVDNLLAARRGDLIETYFSRTWSLTAMGGVVAGLVAILLLFLLPVSRHLVDSLWIVAAVGALASAGVVLRVREWHPEDPPEPPGPEGAADTTTGATRPDVALTVQAVTAGGQVRAFDALRVIRRTRGLLLFFAAYVIAAFAGGSADEAFDMALVTRGLDARAFAGLGIAADLAGVVAPILGLALARRFGAPRALAILLAVPALVVTVLLTGPGAATVVAVAILLDLCDSAWDPVARAHLHREVPSRLRATAASAFEQAAGLAELVSLGVFTLLIGEQGRALRDATPDLVDAFSGGARPPAAVPTGPLGLPIPDLAILLFVFAGVLAVPLLLWQSRPSEAGDRTEQRPVAESSPLQK